ncbi:hypothetical protein GWK47_021004 [Chionoecetes opilio]|uniref:Uncharacterized protein n=1 Tax=Chionoecetes opilio TaxID=41210 RepID=A0A8J5CEN9_CHIOP|nr:hypothetical protein GWK47_021004 [Chionoecetes opilio]
MATSEGRIINRYSSVIDIKQACDRPVDRDRLVGHPCCIEISGVIFKNCGNQEVNTVDHNERSKSPSRASAIRTADGRLVSDMDGQMARWAECMLPFMKSSMSKFSSDRDDLLALKMSLPIENKRSTAALEGMAVLNLMNKSTNTCSPKKAASVSKSLEHCVNGNISYRAEMSCLLEEVAAIGNPSEIVQWLCPHLCPSRGHGSPAPRTGSTQLTDIDWNEEWDCWNDIDHGAGGKGLSASSEDSGSLQRFSPSSPSPQPEASWLSECVTAVSPTCDLMAIGYKNRLAILSRRWKIFSEEKEGMKLITTWKEAQLASSR